ncbi:conserved hypothetical protein [Thioalkalivibrio sp. K90mix]|jgi:hypothetical protein|uniref:hypothetical protein n=1 Tax=unclassified Thioalkalivibrio TaxID=2621013 RepID=UPI000195A487|nr:MULTISPECIES: hypothetical protein [unclassified Thioalkalivibrio]ADC72320.1 conserved hypothetical protein [Thioalkalivibrio sp. K90mix]
MAETFLVAIIDQDREDLALEIAAEEGGMDGTVMHGSGLGFPDHMTFLGVTYQGRESICIWEMDEQRAERIARRLNLELDLLQPYNGLAFTLDAQALAGMQFVGGPAQP